MISSSITTAVEHLSTGKLIAFPTETVYGLGADASNPKAINKIFDAKKRPKGHPLILHTNSIEIAMQYAHFSSLALEIAELFWPGPLTLVLKRTSATLDEVTGGLSTVGIRIPSHPVALNLLHRFGRPLAAPSANPFGTLSPTCVDHVHKYFGDRFLILDGGPCAVGIESTIVDLSSKPAILRPGQINAKSIENITGPLCESLTPAPGRLKKHYAPKTRLILCDDPEKERAKQEAFGKKVAVISPSSSDNYARELYKLLHHLDEKSFDLLIAPRAKNRGIGIAINDRLSKASSGSGHQIEP